MKQIVGTNEAPQAIGTYSQAVKVGNTVYLSGQIALDPETMELVNGDFEKQVAQIFKNTEAVARAAGGSLAQIVKLTIYLTDMNDFDAVNKVMASFVNEPYPARSIVAVSGLPKGASVEMEAVLVLGE